MYTTEVVPLKSPCEEDVEKNLVGGVKKYKFENGDEIQERPKSPEGKKRESWGKGIEFLLSCIAMSGTFKAHPFLLKY
jgi:hypothetical protein